MSKATHGTALPQSMASLNDVNRCGGRSWWSITISSARHDPAKKSPVIADQSPCRCALYSAGSVVRRTSKLRWYASGRCGFESTVEGA